MNKGTMPIGRRTLFAAGAAGTVALAGLPASAAGPADWTAEEKANVKLVTDFCKAWEGDAKVENLMSFMADDAVYKTGTQTHVGRAAIEERYKAFLPAGASYTLRILDTFAKGPLVVTVRHDTSRMPQRTRELGHVGVFIVKNGKIQEWNDLSYQLPDAAAAK